MSRESWEHFRDDTQWFIELGQLWQLSLQTNYLMDIHAFQAAQQVEAQRVQQLPRCPDCAGPLELGVRKCRACHGMLIWLQVDSEVLPISDETREESLARISDNKMAAFLDARDHFIRVSRYALPGMWNKLQLFQENVKRRFGSLERGQQESLRFAQTEKTILDLKAQIDADAKWYRSGSGLFIGIIGMFLGCFILFLVPFAMITFFFPLNSNREQGKSFLPISYAVFLLILSLAGPCLGFLLAPKFTKTFFGRERKLKSSLKIYEAELDQDDKEFLRVTREAFCALNNCNNAFQEVLRRWQSHRYVVQFAMQHYVVLQFCDFNQASLVFPVNPFDPKAVEMLAQIGYSFGIDFRNNAREQDLRNLTHKPTDVPSSNEAQTQYSQTTSHVGGLMRHSPSAAESEKVKALCPGCATRFTLSAKLFGKKAKCKMCGRTFEVPGRASSASDSNSIVIACPACDASLQLTGNNFGKLIRCAKCSSTFCTPG